MGHDFEDIGFMVQVPRKVGRRFPKQGEGRKKSGEAGRRVPKVPKKELVNEAKNRTNKSGSKI